MKILVPLADHDDLTVAHKAIVKYSKTLGDPTVTITVGLREWNMWLRDGKLGYDPAVGVMKRNRFPKVKEKQVQGVRDLGITKIEIVRPDYPTETVRKKLLKNAKGFVGIYEDQLVAERYKLLATSALMRLWVREMSPNFQGIEQDCVLVGPELTMFFLKHIGHLLGWKERIIMPEMVRDPQTGIRSQFSLRHIPVETMATVMGLRRVFLDAKPHLKVGKNEKLVKELNHSFSQGVEIIDATVWEGGIVDGRLESMGFWVPTPNGGSVLIEDVEYHPR